MNSGGFYFFKIPGSKMVQGTVFLSYDQNKKNVPEVWHMGPSNRPLGQTIFINLKKIKPRP